MLMRDHNSNDAYSISQIIPGLMKKFGIEEQHWLTVLEKEWSDIVGKAVAKHTRPSRLEKRKLVVFVDSSVWLNELVRYSRGKILANLQKRFGQDKVRSIAIQLDPDGA